MRERTLKYYDAKNLLLNEIKKLSSGDILPNRNKLAEDLSVSRTTIEKAVSELRDEGILYSVKGSGTFIADQKNLSTAAEERHHQHKADKNGDTWALLISNILYDIYPYILRGLEDFAKEKNKNLMICNTDNDGIKQDEYLRMLLNNGVAGIVIVPAIEVALSFDIFKTYMNLDIPVVSCVRPVYGFNFPGILFNSFQAGFKGTMHLLERGCKKIAFLSQPMYPSSLDRYQGYRTALNVKGIPHDEGYVIYEQSFQIADTGYEITKQLFSKYPDVDGIFAFNDRVAFGIYKALAELGYTVGKDVKIASCDNTDICEKLDIKLTSMGFPLYEIGQLAGKYLYNLCTNGKLPEFPYVVADSELHVRASSQG